MVICHGQYIPGSEDLDDDFERIFKVNFRSVKKLIDTFDEADDTHIVIVTSIAGVRGSRRGDHLYSASKSAAHALVLSGHPRNPGLLLSGVAPGPVYSKMVEESDYDRSSLLETTEVAELIEEILERPDANHRKIHTIERIDGTTIVDVISPK